MAFAGRKNMNHDHAECLYAMMKQGKFSLRDICRKGRAAGHISGLPHAAATQFCP
jgi:hypothetical protein